MITCDKCNFIPEECQCPDSTTNTLDPEPEKMTTKIVKAVSAEPEKYTQEEIDMAKAEGKRLEELFSEEPEKVERKPTKNYPCKGYTLRGKPMVDICWVHGELEQLKQELEDRADSEASLTKMCDELITERDQLKKENTDE